LTSANTKSATSKGSAAVSEEAPGLKSDRISKKNDNVPLSTKNISTNKEVSKSPDLIDILNNIQNIRVPIAEVPVEISSDNTSPTKRASNRVKIAKKKRKHYACMKKVPKSVMQ